MYSMAPKAVPKRKGAPVEEEAPKKKKGGAQPGAGRPSALKNCYPDRHGALLRIGSSIPLELGGTKPEW